MLGGFLEKTDMRFHTSEIDQRRCETITIPQNIPADLGRGETRAVSREQRIFRGLTKHRTERYPHQPDALAGEGSHALTLAGAARARNLPSTPLGASAALWSGLETPGDPAYGCGANTPANPTSDAASRRFGAFPLPKGDCVADRSHRARRRACDRWCPGRTAGATGC